MKDVLLSLKKENRRLSQLAELDWLTGLYNRMATENKVNEILRTKKSGVLFVIDVDDFKMVNDRYGHVAGDSVLRGVAETLSNMTLRSDILGRIGGDEFVIFMPISQEPEFIASRCRQIETRFRDLSSARLVVSRLSLTVCGSGYQPGDNYSHLFDRADQCLIKEKEEREEPLEVLYQVIQQSLRSGDVFTRYSSSQFLLMVSDVTGSQADAIAERIRGKFYRRVNADGRYSLQYGRYPLKQTGD